MRGCFAPGSLWNDELMSAAHYSAGLHQLGDHSYAWLQPDGSWGWSNAGLITGDGVSLLVDTLFDLHLTRRMLEAYAPITESAPIATLVNTHANGDHCYGNELVVGAQIIASTAAAHEMAEVPPSMLAALGQAPGEVGEIFQEYFGAFDFNGITLTLPTLTFDGAMSVAVGGKQVELLEVGPAHTAGDVLVHSPSDGVVYTGDILFIGGTPIVWAGPLSNWVAACDAIIGFGAEHIVPGHGPVTDADGVRAVRDYLVTVDAEAATRQAAGMSSWDAAQEIQRDLWGKIPSLPEWGEFGRIAVNVDTSYKSRDSSYKSADIMEQFRRMARIERGTAA
jgi:cyclase